MKAKEFEIKKRDPNWRAMQDIRRSGAGGQHKDKKRAAKQGEVKHKGRVEEGYTTEKQIMTRIRQIMHDRKLSGTESNAGELHRLKQQLKDMRSQQGVAESETNWSSGKGGGNNFFRDVSGMQNPRSAIKMIKDGMRGMYGDEIAGKLLRGYDDWAAHIGSDDINDVAKAMLPDIKKAWTTRNKRTVKDIGKKSYSPPKERDRVYWDGDEGVAEGDEPDEQYLDKVISDLHKDAFGMRPDHEFGREWMSSSYEEKLRIYNNMLKNLHSGMDEGIGGMIAGGIGQFLGNKIDPLAGEIMRSHGEIAGRKAEYTIRKYMHLLQKALKQQLDSGEKEGVAEGSDWGEPREILEDVLQTLEREVEWPLTEVMDPREVRQLLSPIVRAVNNKLLSMDMKRHS